MEKLLKSFNADYIPAKNAFSSSPKILEAKNLLHDFNIPLLKSNFKIYLATKVYMDERFLKRFIWKMEYIAENQSESPVVSHDFMNKHLQHSAKLYQNLKFPQEWYNAHPRIFHFRDILHFKKERQTFMDNYIHEISHPFARQDYPRCFHFAYKNPEYKLFINDLCNNLAIKSACIELDFFPDFF